MQDVYSAIHKFPGQAFSRLERPESPVSAGGSIHGLRDFQELYQSNDGTAGNREDGSFVNSAVRDFQELYQSNQGTAGNREDGSFVNSAVRDFQELYKARHAHKRLYTVLPKYSKIQVLPGITSCRLMKYNKQAIELNSLLINNMPKDGYGWN